MKETKYIEITIGTKPFAPVTRTPAKKDEQPKGRRKENGKDHYYL